MSDLNNIEPKLKPKALQLRKKTNIRLTTPDHGKRHASIVEHPTRNISEDQTLDVRTAQTGLDGLSQAMTAQLSSPAQPAETTTQNMSQTQTPTKIELSPYDMQLVNSPVIQRLYADNEEIKARLAVQPLDSPAGQPGSGGIVGTILRLVENIGPSIGKELIGGSGGDGGLQNQIINAWLKDQMDFNALMKQMMLKKVTEG
jgi:hypothetical protein